VKEESVSVKGGIKEGGGTWRGRKERNGKEKNALSLHPPLNIPLPLLLCLYLRSRRILRLDELSQSGLSSDATEVLPCTTEEEGVEAGLEVLGVDGGGSERVGGGDVL
jgi:hypothetical protein